MRVDGYAPIEDYAVVGDGRTCALVARDGSIDWLCLPDVDSGAVLARILDARRGGAFELAPAEPFATERRYLPGTNVLETTFRTAGGTVRVTDALTLQDAKALTPLRELVRAVDGVEGRVPMRWRLEPRFGFGTDRTWTGRRAGRFAAGSGRTAILLATWDAGEEREVAEGVEGTFEARPGERAVLTLAAAHREPLVLARRDDVVRRLEKTEAFWRRWSSRAAYDGPWRDLVVRSALVLKLLCFAPSGAIVAAPTASLPEWLGGTRNWDYRYTWIRDAAYTLTALMRLGYDDEAAAFSWWIAHATALSRPELKVLYRVDGALGAGEEELPLAGYRGSRPVRVGNGAATQTQLDVYGAMLESVWLHACHTGTIGGAPSREVAGIADWVCDHWREPDAGIWEVRGMQAHFTQSKAMCWVALDRAGKLAARGLIPDRRDRWRAEAAAIRRFVDEKGWDPGRGSYVRAPDLPELDASLLTLALYEYDDPASRRLAATVDAVRRELSDGPLVHRYRGDDGVGGDEGAFLTCSFWLAGALAKRGDVDAAAELFDQLAALANDVGLYAEEVAPDGSFLGNFPQALVHLALIDAATALVRAREAR